MKFIITLILSLQSFTVQAVFCDNYPTKIDTDRVYAEVISRSHLELELVVVGKQDHYRSSLIKVTGGKGYRPNSLPSCNAEQEAPLEWVSTSIATHSTGDYSTFTSSYRICLLNLHREAIAEYIVCNRETGD